MSAFRSRLNKFVALLGLVAVLVGAFEHEDLIFQDAGAATREGGISATHGDGPVVSTAAVGRTPGESGTEGIFRSEENRLWLSPRQEMRYPLQEQAHERRVMAALRVAGAAVDWRRGMAGVVVLRL